MELHHFTKIQKILAFFVLGLILILTVATFITVQRVQDETALNTASEAREGVSLQTGRISIAQQEQVPQMQTAALIRDDIPMKDDTPTQEYPGCNYDVSCTTGENPPTLACWSERIDTITYHCNGEGFEIKNRISTSCGDYSTGCSNEKKAGAAALCCTPFSPNANGCEEVMIDPRLGYEGEHRGNDIGFYMQRFAAKCWFKQKNQPTYEYIDKDGDGKPELYSKCCPK